MAWHAGAAELHRLLRRIEDERRDVDDEIRRLPPKVRLFGSSPVPH
jgi:hypothetical protein